jgi:divalent metal cation (Fe/Co/Zn/Cd) transporter
MQEKNSIAVIIFPLITGIVFALLLAGIEYLLGFGSTFFMLLIAVFIGNYLYKNLHYYTTFHKVLAAIYALFVFFVNLYTTYFLFVLIDLEATFAQAFNYLFSLDALLVIFSSFGFFDYLIMIVMPIIAFQYLNRKSAS